MSAILQAVHPVLAAGDVSISIQFFERLGFTARFRDAQVDPKYAVVARDGIELHIQWADPGQWAEGIDRPAYRILVNDVDAFFEEIVNTGDLNPGSDHHSPWQRPGNTPWGTREFHMRDPGLNSLQFYRPLANRPSDDAA